MASYRAGTPIDSQIRSAVDVLRHGGVIAVPTDTLYGLAASALNPGAVARLYAIKGRPSAMALPVLLAEVSEIPKYVADVPDLARKLAEEFLPGPLTIVLRRGAAIPDVVTGGQDTVGVRVPDHPVPRQIVRLLGGPITGTSANRSGKPGLTTADAVRRELGTDVDYIVDGGECEGGVPSTVIDVSTVPPRLVREGAVSREEIERICGMKVL